MTRVRPSSVAASTVGEQHPRATLLSDFILGSQDGLVNVLGILLGLVSAGQTRSIVLVACFAALAAETISMAAVAYTSTRARRQLYLSELTRERWEMEHLPEAERGEVEEILTDWGFEGEERKGMVDRIVAKPKAMLDMMMAFELRLAPVPEDQPLKSAYVVGVATLVGSFLPIVPFLLTANVVSAAIASVIVSAVMLFLIGWYEARTTIGTLWTSAGRMLLIGMAAGLAGYLVGLGIHTFWGV